ncbi:coiled-coil domain-containing protein 181 isoform X1 [Trichomycterus rosablanca]|uniref:coiled-coil domain-containing protein 181 isoform X1 n=1 Tax=Trichomycterus rosablanca TaxID=2290929 RepID=UPI002F3555CE
MTEVASRTQQVEYEDDFEKDLDWLISEESKSEEQVRGYVTENSGMLQDEEDFEAQIDRELNNDEGNKKANAEHSTTSTAGDAEDERWPTPLDPIEGVVDDENEETDAEKKLILQKIEQANRQLQDQEAPDVTRHRRLHFKDNLVDLVVPANEYPPIPSESETDNPTVVSDHLEKLKISAQQEGQTDGTKEGRVLVEKDGKFDLVSLKEVESQGLLPPIPATHIEGQREPGKSPSPSPKLTSSSASSSGTESCFVPRPPARPRTRPNSASHAQRRGLGQGSKRRVQSANGVSSHATYFLSPEQKELLSKQQQKKERITREEEERRREEEEQKRQENEQAFRTWFMKKRQQLQEGRRVQRAQEMERMSGKRECCDPAEAYKLWLQKKQEQQMKERQLEELRRLELESSVYLHRPEECETAFRL